MMNLQIIRFIVLNSLFLLPYVHSEMVRDASLSEAQDCDAHCNSAWGRVPLFNIPWSRGRRTEDDQCVCRFNDKDLHQFMTKICVQKSFWSSIESKRGFAEEGIKEKLSQLSLQKQFNIFKEAYGKEYSSSAEESKRFGIFKENLVKIDNLMANRKGSVVFEVGPFTDLTSKEFNAFVGIIRPKRKSDRESTPKPERKLSRNKSSEPERKSSRDSSLRPERKSSRDKSPRPKGKSSGDNSSRPEGKSSRNNSPRPEGKSSRDKSPRPEGTSSFFRSLMPDHRKSGQKDQSLKPRMLDPDSGSDAEHPGSGSPGRPERRRSADPTPSRDLSSTRNFPNSLPRNWRPAPFGTLHYIGPEPEGNILADSRIPNLYPPTEAQNQFGRKCGACWAFATVNMVEMMLAKEQNKIDRLSVQAILDCDENTYGCDGGGIVAALEYMEEHGVPLADVYPYEAKNGNCRPYTPYVKVAEFDEVDPEDLEEHLQLRPVAAAMFSSPNLQFYIRGVFDSDDCDDQSFEGTNHVALIVGHYADSWIIRNSMPTNWGLQGHMLIKKGRCAVGSQLFELLSITHGSSAKRQRTSS